ncbi:patatin-like phospholipase family protein [Caldimonas brevitalea]|uniref:NTE family protein n=1 Tax=Caldimonas brevitalea TaxID=413882 RepID=A0A0G3BL19_9BURK|nr:patatin-like phospholipase family protein [Caldimonas brevitalea]AKJ27235.1 NTE family protein [Caldimonas brevitalea]
MHLDTTATPGAYLDILDEVVEAARDGGRRPVPVLSDLVSADGQQQFVDLVMEGGGALGIALVGYACALERLGVRFLCIGGASAGAVVALLLGAAGRPPEARAQRLITLVEQMPLREFIDGGWGAQWAFHVYQSYWRRSPGAAPERLPRKLLKWAATGAAAVVNTPRLLRRHGLCPGLRFHHWLDDALAEVGLPGATTADLDRRLAVAPGEVRFRAERLRSSDAVTALGEHPAVVAMAASELRTERRVFFPEMARQELTGALAQPVSLFARASMSIPLVFEPLRLTPGGQRTADKHSAHVFVDGGVLSNFPIDAFHDRDHVPACPTVGIKLAEEATPPPITSLTGLLVSMFTSARHSRDLAFLEDNPEFRQLIAHADTQGLGWLDFEMSREDQLRLFRAGAVAACEWVFGSAERPGFDWDAYKGLRRSQLSMPAPRRRDTP